MTMLPADPSRMLGDLDALRRIGADGQGVRRPAFGDADIAARVWLAGRMRDAGLEPVVDEWGNLFGLPPGEAPCMLVGSHTDTQPLGGWLDGSYGVICALELARAAVAAGGPRLAVVSFQDEEGRFGGLTGSSVWSGAVSREAADALVDAGGVRLAAARRRAGEIAPMASVPHSRFSGFIEPHIEQGPVLDGSGECLAVVDSIAGVRSYAAIFEGEANHAGTTPMALRRDASRAMLAFGAALDRAFAEAAGDRTVWTMGRIVVEPNAPSVIPSSAALSIQFRDTDRARLEALAALVQPCADQAARAAGLGVEVMPGFAADPVAMDATLVEGLAAACEAVAPGRWRRMHSGALHDATHVSRVMPAAMLFVPSIGGISHNPAEDTERLHLGLGLLALARAVENFQTRG